MAPVVRQVAGAGFGDASAPPRADRDRWFVNTCQAWRDGGPLATLLARGDIDGMRALVVRRDPPS